MSKYRGRRVNGRMMAPDLVGEEVRGGSQAALPAPGARRAATPHSTVGVGAPPSAGAPAASSPLARAPQAPRTVGEAPAARPAAAPGADAQRGRRAP